MIALPRKFFYAVEAVLYIAYNGAGLPVTAKEIASRQGLSPRYLEQLMQRLVRCGILSGVRGPRGGYRLGRDRRRITIAEICDVLGDDTEDSVMPNSTPLGAVVWPQMRQAQVEAMEKLRQVNIADLCDRALVKSIPKTPGDRTDFAI